MKKVLAVLMFAAAVFVGVAAYAASDGACSSLYGFSTPWEPETVNDEDILYRTCESEKYSHLDVKNPGAYSLCVQARTDSGRTFSVRELEPFRWTHWTVEGTDIEWSLGVYKKPLGISYCR